MWSSRPTPGGWSWTPSLQKWPSTWSRRRRRESKVRLGEAKPPSRSHSWLVTCLQATSALQPGSGRHWPEGRRPFRCPVSLLPGSEARAVRLGLVTPPIHPRDQVNTHTLCPPVQPGHTAKGLWGEEKPRAPDAASQWHPKALRWHRKAPRWRPWL